VDAVAAVGARHLHRRGAPSVRVSTALSSLRHQVRMPWLDLGSTALFPCCHHRFNPDWNASLRRITSVSIRSGRERSAPRPCRSRRGPGCAAASVGVETTTAGHIEHICPVRSVAIELRRLASAPPGHPRVLVVGPSVEPAAERESREVRTVVRFVVGPVGAPAVLNAPTCSSGGAASRPRTDPLACASRQGTCSVRAGGLRNVRYRLASVVGA
jgi:hypothetical protein